MCVQAAYAGIGAQFVCAEMQAATRNLGNRFAGNLDAQLSMYIHGVSSTLQVTPGVIKT